MNETAKEKKIPEKEINARKQEVICFFLAAAEVTFKKSWNLLRNCRSTESHVLKRLEQVHIQMNK